MWYHKFHTFMLSQGYKQSEIDHCLYTKQAMYLDDILIAGRQLAKIIALKSKMAKAFKMKDMGKASHILSMRIQRDRSRKLLYLS